MSIVAGHSTELIRIHLDEGEVAEAVVLLNTRSGKRQTAPGGWNRVDIEVAEAAEKSHPETSLKIYQGFPSAVNQASD